MSDQDTKQIVVRKFRSDKPFTRRDVDKQKTLARRQARQIKEFTHSTI